MTHELNLDLYDKFLACVDAGLISLPKNAGLIDEFKRWELAMKTKNPDDLSFAE